MPVRHWQDNSPILLADENEARNVIKADRLCRHIGTELRKAYPGRNWHVEVDLTGGVAKIRCPNISMKYGYLMKVTDNTHELTRRAKMAGGEILERFRLSRSRASSGDVFDLKSNIAGESMHAKAGGF